VLISAAAAAAGHAGRAIPREEPPLWTVTAAPDERRCPRSSPGGGRRVLLRRRVGCEQNRGTCGDAGRSWSLCRPAASRCRCRTASTAATGCATCRAPRPHRRLDDSGVRQSSNGRVRSSPPAHAYERGRSAQAGTRTKRPVPAFARRMTTTRPPSKSAPDQSRTGVSQSSSRTAQRPAATPTEDRLVPGP